MDQEKGNLQTKQPDMCACFSAPYRNLGDEKVLGMDDDYALISLFICSVCGQVWLRYFYELEAFTASGRWYLGAIDPDQVFLVNPQTVKAILESLPWYFCGGSYFRGLITKNSGRIFLNP